MRKGVGVGVPPHPPPLFIREKGESRFHHRLTLTRPPPLTAILPSLSRLMHTLQVLRMHFLAWHSGALVVHTMLRPPHTILRPLLLKC